jgi:hypothetical protein
MKRRTGFTLVEVAVAGLIAAVVALMATMLFVPAARAGQEAQTALAEQGDLLQVRRLFEADVHRAVGAQVSRGRLVLRMSDGRQTCYRFANGALERATGRRSCGSGYRALTTQSDYEGAFEVQGPGVRLRFSRAPSGQALPEIFVVTRARPSLR